MTNVTQLQLDYFDQAGLSLKIDTLAERARVAQVEIHLVVQTASPLSNQSRPSYAISIRTAIRNVAIQ
jgi:hypothetical protein